MKPKIFPKDLLTTILFMTQCNANCHQLDCLCEACVCKRKRTACYEQNSVPDEVNLRKVCSTMLSISRFPYLRLAAQTVMGSSSGLSLHQCLQTCLLVCRAKRLSYHADLHIVSRCCTRGESKDHTGKKVSKKGSTLALKPRADITRSPKQGYQWSHNPPKKISKKVSVYIAAETVRNINGIVYDVLPTTTYTFPRREIILILKQKSVLFQFLLKISS